MAGELEFRGLFRPQAMRQLVPGSWYLGFRCQACRETFAILDDPAGDGEIEPMGNAVVEVTCPVCLAANRYNAGDMVVFQSATGMAGQDVPPAGGGP